MHAVLVAVALVALLCVPCTLALVLFADLVLMRLIESMSRAAHQSRVRWESARLERSTGLARGWPGLRTRQVPSVQPPTDPPFEKVAADLRRLARQRVAMAARSPVWVAAVQRAYDERLQVACRELEIAEYLQQLDGVDLDIERVRVEGLLAAAGLRLAVVDADGR